MGSSSVFLYKKNLKSGVFWYARIPKNGDSKGFITRSTGLPATDDGRSYMLAYQKAESIAQEIRHKSIPAPLFLDYIKEFWSEGSDYLQHRALVQQKPPSPTYVNNNLSGIKKWVAPYPPFEKIKLSELKTGIISDWQVWAIENGCGLAGYDRSGALGSPPW